MNKSFIIENNIMLTNDPFIYNRQNNRLLLRTI